MQWGASAVKRRLLTKLDMIFYLDGHRWRCGHVAVQTCQVRRETAETAEETCDWALTVTFRLLWMTSSQPRCLPFPLHSRRVWRRVHRQVLSAWRPGSPTGTRSAAVSHSYVTTARRGLNHILSTRISINVVAFLLAFYYRAMLCIRGTSHGPAYVSSVCVCLSVSVCLSQADVLLKRQNAGSHK